MQVGALEVEPDLPEGWIPLEAVVLIKCVDDDGDIGYCFRVTESLTSVEALGMVRVADHELVSAIGGCWVGDDDN